MDLRGPDRRLRHVARERPARHGGDRRAARLLALPHGDRSRDQRAARDRTRCRERPPPGQQVRPGDLGHDSRPRLASRVRRRHHARRRLRDDGVPVAAGGRGDRARRRPLELPEGAHPAGDHARDRGRPLHGADHARVDGRDPGERLRGDGQAQGAAREPRPLASRRAERARPDVPGHRAEPRLPRRRHRRRRGGLQLPGRRAPARRLGARPRHAGRPGRRAPDRGALRHPQPARRPRDDPRQPPSTDVHCP